ncbi:hypothetical protein GDO81_016812 [Engystomops pustulosus]|uniref:Uncharacterized protein n=1 Tax=Engystomops pustulosus TaxID=76066 RepID=A0AAV7AF92_ENGPU|nr:hypothetical protein GDO81_016812 [Engystomops pustulosus]
MMSPTRISNHCGMCDPRCHQPTCECDCRRATRAGTTLPNTQKYLPVASGAAYFSHTLTHPSQAADTGF